MTPNDTAHRSEAKPLRLFIAIDLPEAIRAQLDQLSSNLQKGFLFTPSHPSWSGAAGMHLTLAFLGNRPGELVKPLGRAMDQVAQGFAPLIIEIKRLGVFPHWRNPRVLWAGIRDRSHQIEDLHRLLEQQLTYLGYEPEGRDFHPHLTLARFKSVKGAHAGESIVNSHQDFKFGPFEAGEMILFRSELHPAGARYTPLHRAKFSAPAKHFGGPPLHPEEEEQEQ
jgi:RNA 2',3'-cyclic 3'-phosphodiesterase